MGLKEKLPELALELATHKADILFGVGIAGVVASAGFSGWGTLKAKKALEERKKTLESVEQEHENTTEKEEKAELVKANATAAGKVAVAYSPAMACCIIGVVCLSMAHCEQKRSLVAMTAAYNSLLALFTEYRERVRQDAGPEKDLLYLKGAEEVEVEEETETKSGKKKIVKKTDLRPCGLEDVYHRKFDSRCSQWEHPDHMPGYNLSFARQQREIAQHIFETPRGRKHKKYLLLVEVCDLFGMSYDDFGGDILTLGWHEDAPHNDGFIDFGILENFYKKDWVETAEGDVWLEFNCDGDIREWL